MTKYYKLRSTATLKTEFGNIVIADAIVEEEEGLAVYGYYEEFDDVILTELGPDGEVVLAPKDWQTLVETP